MPARRKVLGEYDVRLAAMVEAMEAHIKADAVAFAGLIDQVTEVNKDVKSIIASRNYAAGVWKALSIIGTILLAAGTLYFMWKGAHV
jgi:hypothetical protein